MRSFTLFFVLLTTFVVHLVSAGSYDDTLVRRAEQSPNSAQKDKAAKVAQYGNFASPSILEGGTLFYIGASVTAVLWVTGKVIDIKIERQERYAERLVYRI